MIARNWGVFFSVENGTGIWCTGQYVHQVWSLTGQKGLKLCSRGFSELFCRLDEVVGDS